MNSQRYMMAMIAGLLSFTVRHASAQTQPGVAIPAGIAIGISAGHYAFDPALGIEVSSPPIISEKLRFRLRTNVTWLEQYKSLTNRWTTFNSYWAGAVYNTRVIDRARFFVEAGSYHIAPKVTFSSKKILSGYFGSVGVELFPLPNTRQNFCYFFGVGFTHIKARADQLEGSPQFGSGFTFTNGFRYYF